MERRNFLKTAALGSAALFTSVHTKGISQDRKLKFGLIGAGWYGMVIAQAALKAGGAEFVAVCDVDSAHLDTSARQLASAQGSEPRKFANYKELLDMKGLDGVFIGTPPHWHALQFIAACEKGLNVYLEKPLSYDIREGLAMVEAANKAGNIVQVGFQRRQSGAFKKAKEMIEAGTVGDIRQISAQIHYNPGRQDATIQAPPSTLNWDEWCGPAPKLDYRPSIGHKAWRLEKEYGNGHLVDWGIHLIDAIRMVMGEAMPTEFYSKGGIYEFKDQITTPDTLTANFAFEKAPVVWQHRFWGIFDPNRDFNNGVLFHGTKGTLFSSDSKLLLYSPSKPGSPETVAIDNVDMQLQQVAAFVEAVRSDNRKLITCDPADAFRSSATVQLAMISYNTGSLVKWDAAKNEIVGNSEASKLMSRPYRDGYKHP